MNVNSSGLRIALGDNGAKGSRIMCVIAAAVIILVACAWPMYSFIYPDPDPEVIITDGDIDVFWYEDGRPVKKCRLSPQSTAMRAAVALLKNHRRQWRVNPICYAPSLFLRGKEFSVDLHEEMIILNYSYEGRSTQVSSRARKRELDSMRYVLSDNWDRD
jgi:hypothetical protein